MMFSPDTVGRLRLEAAVTSATLVQGSRTRKGTGPLIYTRILRPNRFPHVSHTRSSTHHLFYSSDRCCSKTCWTSTNSRGSSPCASRLTQFDLCFNPNPPKGDHRLHDHLASFFGKRTGEGPDQQYLSANAWTFLGSEAPPPGDTYICVGPLLLRLKLSRRKKR